MERQSSVRQNHRKNSDLHQVCEKKYFVFIKIGGHKHEKLKDQSSYHRKMQFQM